MITTNLFSPIASSAGHMLMSVSESPPAVNPLVSKPKVVDEKEGKDLKQKHPVVTVNPQVAKKRKGKGKASNPSL